MSIENVSIANWISLKGTDILRRDVAVLLDIDVNICLRFMYILTKEALNMTCDPASRVTLGPHNDRDFVLNAKRKVPDTCQDHLQEKPGKIPKLVDKNHNEAENGKPPPVLSPRANTVTTNESNRTKQRYRSTRAPEPEFNAFTQLPLKVRYEASVRRFSVSEFTTFKDLKMILARRMLEDKVMAIEYKDDQGDRVVLSSEKDMTELSRISREGGMKPMQLCVSLWPR